MRFFVRWVLQVPVAALLTACALSDLCTPEGACRQAVEALRRSDQSKFLEICATATDVRDALDRHPEIARDQQAEALDFWTKYDVDELRVARLLNFERVRDAADWKN